MSSQPGGDGHCCRARALAAWLVLLRVGRMLFGVSGLLITALSGLARDGSDEHPRRVRMAGPLPAPRGNARRCLAHAWRTSRRETAAKPG